MTFLTYKINSILLNIPPPRKVLFVGLMLTDMSRSRSKNNNVG